MIINSSLKPGYCLPNMVILKISFKREKLEHLSLNLKQAVKEEVYSLQEILMT